jgi:MFS family permease
MSSRARLVLLGALCAGALLVGIELLITAVALPRIVADLGDWTQLRRASWIVNGYLLSYIATMPLAGRAADRYGLTRLFMVALGVFAAGSLLSGVAQTLDQLIAARLLQGVGAGAILPLATAGASHLYEGHRRARALGVVGACTFLGMAIGPFLGATILDSFELRPAFIAAGMASGTIADLVTPSWRWVFLLGAPLALVTLSYVWAASPQRVDVHTPARIDATGAVLFTAALASGLLTFSTLGEPQPDGGAIPIPALAALACLVATALTVRHMLRVPDPFVDPGLFHDRVFSGAVLVSLLTGYALATAIIGAAVYVDRVRYAGPEEQRIVLGTLAVAMAVGALGSGLALRLVGIVPLSLAGLAVGIGGMAVLATLDAGTPLATLLLGVGAFGLGFGATVTPRSTAAVEALGRRAFGVASAGVTVARTVGMAIGLAVLTGFGTQRIEALSRVLTDQAARDAVLPATLQGRALLDPLVIGELERWAAREAASILAGLFAVAGVMLAAAVAPTLLMNARSARPGRATIDSDEPPQRHNGDTDQGGHSGDEGAGPALAL